jgi:hypothetical protein
MMDYGLGDQFRCLAVEEMTHILQYQAVITSQPSAFRFESPPEDSRITGDLE